ncbi:hypothetical protein RHSIM_Rhsim03G0190900 [Rhododendron simsii]|uniref:C2H2-type domain-containing protein n=1 Tax=Rhododendron simsii TaxID=118357 RepID=A0A834H4C5_RHOSS|nr:hypothetical protein RHSIM_Rhsim03G0190900 [Rhododendron simsii]
MASMESDETTVIEKAEGVTVIKNAEGVGSDDEQTLIGNTGGAGHDDETLTMIGNAEEGVGSDSDQTVIGNAEVEEDMYDTYPYCNICRPGRTSQRNLPQSTPKRKHRNARIDCLSHHCVRKFTSASSMKIHCMKRHPYLKIH